MHLSFIIYNSVQTRKRLFAFNFESLRCLIEVKCAVVFFALVQNICHSLEILRCPTVVLSFTYVLSVMNLLLHYFTMREFHRHSCWNVFTILFFSFTNGQIIRYYKKAKINARNHRCSKECLATKLSIWPKKKMCCVTLFCILQTIGTPARVLLHHVAFWNHFGCSSHLAPFL